MDPGTVRDQLVELLDEANSALELYEGAEAPPERSYVAQGAVAWDCDQLTVHLVRIRPKLLDSRSAACAVVLVATYAVTLLRCVPGPDDNGNPPSADELNVANQQLAVDGEALLKSLTRAWAQGSWPAGVPCRRVEWGALEPLAPSGKLAGWRLEVSVQL